MLHVSGPEADYLRNLLYKLAPNAKNDTEVFENMPNYYRGMMRLRSVENVAGILGRGSVPKI